MSDDLLLTQVRSRTLDEPGRSLNTARDQHFVIDEPAYNGGPGESVTPAESFLAGVSACGVLLVEAFARRDGVPLRKVEASIEGVRLRTDPANFRRVSMRFELTGPTQQQAEKLVEAYKVR